MKRIILSVLTMSALLCGCQKDHVSELAQGRGTIQATIEEISATRTVMDENNNIRWSEGDQIVGFMKSTLGVKYQVTAASVGKTSASFEEVSSGGLNAGTELEHIIAYYPYSSSVSAAKSGSNYTLDVILPTEQTYVAGSFGNGAMPMVAVSETNNITFKNICGGMKLQLKGTQKVASIKVEGKNGELLSGAATVTAYTDETKPAITMASDASTSVTLNCGDGVQLNESTATEFILAMPPVLFSKGFTVTVTDIDGGTQAIGTDKVNEVKRSTILVMPAVTLDSSDVEVIVNLSKEGTANSYIVSCAGSYKFTPTKGNSNESVGTIASAVTLWESFGTDVTPSAGDLIKNVKYEGGVISFETPLLFKEGNAVIAAKDENGEILWSWHIWLTDEPQKHVYYNNAGVMMDRNIGATSATAGDIEALGLLYQWGRKDPFLGASSIKMTENDTTEIQIRARSTIVWPEQVESSEHTGTIEYSIQNPTTFIYWNLLDRDWLYSGSGAKNMSRWQAQKTIYDPCPAGWRVPDGGVSGIWATASGISDGLHSPEIRYDTENVGVDFAGILGDYPSIWYPAAGSLSPPGSIEFPYSGHYWSVTPYMLGAGIFEFTESYQYPGHSFIGTKVYSYCASAHSVRCVQE